MRMEGIGADRQSKGDHSLAGGRGGRTMEVDRKMQYVE
jgi:hypothetical protein